jgi:glutathione S-transferase
MLKLYAAPRTRSLRVAWLLEELGADYEVVLSEFVPTRSRFFIQQTPTGKYPTIDDDGFVMFESGAIIEYLLEKYGDTTLVPAPGTPLKGEWLQWLHFADGTAFPPLGIVICLAVYRDDADQHQPLIADARQRAATAFELLERHVEGRQWILGDAFSAADIMLGFTLLAGRLLGIVQPDSGVGGYLERLEARPAFRRALDRTGGFG